MSQPPSVEAPPIRRSTPIALGRPGTEITRLNICGFGMIELPLVRGFSEISFGAHSGVSVPPRVGGTFPLSDAPIYQPAARNVKTYLPKNSCAARFCGKTALVPS